MIENADSEGERPPRPARFFLNVDLDLDSSEDLSALVHAFEPDAYSLERPAGRASFELNLAISTKSPEPLILEFVRLIENLPAAARAVWDGATRRTFDLGFQSGRAPIQETHRLSPATLGAAASVGAEIAVTIYALEPNESAQDATVRGR